MKTITVDQTAFRIPTSDSHYQLWVVYFDELKKKWTTNFARKAWLITWQYNGSLSLLNEKKFTEWLSANKINVSTTTSRALSSVTGTVENVFSLGENLTGALVNAPKIALYLGLGVSGLAFYLVFNSIRKGDLNASTLSTLVPGASAVKLASKL